MPGRVKLGAVAVERLNDTLDLAHRVEHSVRAHIRRIDGQASMSAGVLADRYGLIQPSRD